VFATRDALAEILGLPAKQIRVISRFIGGGFGCKLSMWAHVPLTAMAARHLNRPLKLVLERAQMFGPVGFRPSTTQKLSIGADKSGRLQAIKHDVISETSAFAEFVETATVCTKSTYACANVETSQRILRLDIGKPTWMRAPGHATGSFAVESAMDELAIVLGIDPLELRILNFADKEPDSKLPWSSNVLRDCYRQGAERFGWANRVSKPGSVKRNELLVGMGMATSLHASWRNPASASVKLLSDGTALVQSGTQDIGTGTYTVMSQIAANWAIRTFLQPRCLEDQPQP
jgi:xanthine dehydrogenase YagR molybdenum-binding subunit